MWNTTGSDEETYRKKQDQGLVEHEALCKRCGKCCGTDSSEPCANLGTDPQGKYYCKSYDNRLGAQRTISGRTFTCVPIRDVLSKGLPYEGCGYTK